jgi:nucleotide sugar dehydrogenase
LKVPIPSSRIKDFISIRKSVTKKISVLGLGYVGLPLLAAIEKSGKYETVGYDPNEEKCNMISSGTCPIDDHQCEMDMKEIKLNVSTDTEILKDSDIFIICVPTPVNDDFTPDYKYVIAASELTAKYLKRGAIVVLESTVNPGTSEEIVKPSIEAITELRAGDDFAIAHCPERINPGDPKWTVYNIPRNVGIFPIERSDEIVEFYSSIIDAEINAVSSLKVAEATKIVENTFRDVNIAFVNELAQSFDAMDIDLIETLKGSSNKPFGFLAHWPGRGVGGHCIAVDPYYLIKRAEAVGFNHEFLKRARDINNKMPRYTVGRLQNGLNEVEMSVKGSKITMLGLSYKENIKDLRESPCFEIAARVKALGGILTIYDPFALDESDVDSLQDALNDASAVIVATAHDDFKNLHEIVKDYPSVKVIIDGMNKLDQSEIEGQGIIYKGIGR